MPPVCEFLTQLVCPGRDLGEHQKQIISPWIGNQGDAADGTYGSPQRDAGFKGTEELLVQKSKFLLK